MSEPVFHRSISFETQPKKVLTDAAIKSVPAIAAKLLTKYFNIPDLTLDEYIKNVFLANPRSPQFFRLRTRVTPEQVFETSRSLFEGMKAKIGNTTTKDGWPLMFGEFEEAFFRWPGLDGASRLYAIGALKEGEETTVVIGCRFTGDDTKWNPFGKWFEKASVRQVLAVAKAVDPHAVPEKIARD